MQCPGRRGDLGPRGTALLGDQQRAVGLHGHHHAVGHREQRRGVDDDDVRRLAQRQQQVRHRLGAEQLAGVRRGRPAGQHQQRLVAPALHHVAHLHVADQHVGQADAGVQAQVLVDLRAAQVGVDQQHPPARLGERDGQVAGEGGLALALQGAGHRDDAGRLVDVHEAQVGPQLADRLGARRGRGVARRSAARCGRLARTGSHRAAGCRWRVAGRRRRAAGRRRRRAGRQTDAERAGRSARRG